MKAAVVVGFGLTIIAFALHIGSEHSWIATYNNTYSSSKSQQGHVSPLFDFYATNNAFSHGTRPHCDCVFALNVSDDDFGVKTQPNASCPTTDHPMLQMYSNRTDIQSDLSDKCKQSRMMQVVVFGLFSVCLLAFVAVMAFENNPSALVISYGVAFVAFCAIAVMQIMLVDNVADTATHVKLNEYGDGSYYPVAIVSCVLTIAVLLVIGKYGYESMRNNGGNNGSFGESLNSLL